MAIEAVWVCIGFVWVVPMNASMWRMDIGRSLVCMQEQLMCVAFK